MQMGFDSNTWDPNKIKKYEQRAKCVSKVLSQARKKWIILQKRRSQKRNHEPYDRNPSSNQNEHDNDADDDADANDDNDDDYNDDDEHDNDADDDADDDDDDADDDDDDAGVMM